MRVRQRGPASSANWYSRWIFLSFTPAAKAARSPSREKCSRKASVLWEDMAEEQLEMGGVIARSVGGEVIAVGQKLKMAGAEIHVHDIMIALAEGAGEGIALGLGLALLGRQKAL